MIFRILLHGLNHGPDRPPEIVDPGGADRTAVRTTSYSQYQRTGGGRIAARRRCPRRASRRMPVRCRFSRSDAVRGPPSCRHRRDAGDGPAGPARSWWRRSGSNRRPPACKAGALPAELRPLPGTTAGRCRRSATARRKWWAWVDLNYRPHAYQACALTKLSYRPRSWPETPRARSLRALPAPSARHVACSWRPNTEGIRRRRCAAL